MLPPLLHRPGSCLCTVRLPQPLLLCLFYLSVYLLPCRTCKFDMKLGRNRAQTLLERNPVELLYFSLNPCGGGRRRRKLLKHFMLFHVHTDSCQSVLLAWRFKRVIEKSGEMPRRQQGKSLLHCINENKNVSIISIYYSLYIAPRGYLPDQNRERCFSIHEDATV